MNLFTPEAAAKRELLYNKPASCFKFYELMIIFLRQNLSLFTWFTPSKIVSENDVSVNHVFLRKMN
jgi:hypothetical protein